MQNRWSVIHTDMGRRYLKDDVNVVTQRILVLEWELEGHCIRVEVGARLHGENERLYYSCQDIRIKTHDLQMLDIKSHFVSTCMLMPLTSRPGFSGSRQLLFIQKNCLTSSSPSRRIAWKPDKPWLTCWPDCLENIKIPFRDEQTVFGTKNSKSICSHQLNGKFRSQLFLANYFHRS